MTPLSDDDVNAIVASMTPQATVVEDVERAFQEAIEEVSTEDVNLESTNQEYEDAVAFLQELEDPAEEPIEEPIEEEHYEEKIPRNSNSALVDETTSRFSGAIWYENIQSKVITLAGLGGIGSYVLFLLARMKPNSIFIYDDDVVESGNMSGQLYSTSDVGKYKVDAISTMASIYASYNSVFSFKEKFTESSEPSDIMICGFDSMKARHMYYNKWLDQVKLHPENERNKCLFIDGRLAAESMQVFCITGDDVYSQEEYAAKWLFTDDNADATQCSYKQTTFCANMIGSIMVNLFVNFCANECNPLVPRDLPFMTSYEAETMYFKTEV